MKRNTRKAFLWIINILKSNNIPFQIAGGLAARIYGSMRPLADIDIGIPDKMIPTILPEVKDYIIYGPERYLDDSFDLLLMTLNFAGQEIDIYGAEGEKLYNTKTLKWEFCGTDIMDSVEKEVYGIKVPMIKPKDLIDYKKQIARPCDLEDIKNLENSQSTIKNTNHF